LNKLKPNFSIQEIGKLRFYSGLLIGVLFSIIFNQLFRLTTKIASITTYWDIENWIVFSEFYVDKFYSILISFTSVSFAFCFTNYLWLGKPLSKNRRRKRHTRSGQINSIFMLFFTLIFLTKLWSFSIGTGLGLKRNFGFICFFLPIFIYSYCWILLRRVYILSSLRYIPILIYIVFSLILSVT